MDKIKSKLYFHIIYYHLSLPVAASLQDPSCCLSVCLSGLFLWGGGGEVKVSSLL
jgi:hypothetical protein